MLLCFESCIAEKPEWWARVFSEHAVTLQVESKVKSVINSVEILLARYRETSAAERIFRDEISKLSLVTNGKSNTSSLEMIVTTLQDISQSRMKLVDNLERNVRKNLVTLYNGGDHQNLSCKSMKEARKSLERVAEEKNEKLARFLAMTNNTKRESEIKGKWLSISLYVIEIKEEITNVSFFKISIFIRYIVYST
jgi:hypothetical protein